VEKSLVGTNGAMVVAVWLVGMLTGLMVLVVQVMFGNWLWPKPLLL